MPALGSVLVQAPVQAPELGWAPGLPAWLPVRQVLLPPQVRVPQLPGAVPRVLAPALQLQALRRAALARARAQVSARVRVRRRQVLPQLARPALPALPAGALAVRLALLVRRWPGPGRARPAHRYQGVPGLVLARAF
jgi:hypothetical protein